MRSLLIATTPRSGSWLLAEALHATDLAGEPQEYFGWEAFDAWSKVFGLTTEAPHLDFVAAAIEYSTTPNGIFSAKMHWSQLRRFVDRVRSSPGEWPSTPAGVLRRCFPDVHLVHLRRTDTARQAISYWRANHAQQWWDVGGRPSGTPELEADFQQIRWCEDFLVDHDRRWHDLIERYRFPALEVTYEGFVADRAGTVDAILELIGVEHDPIELPPPQLQRQADERTEEWLVGYLALRDDLAGLPSAWRWEGPEIVPEGDVMASPSRGAARAWRPVPVPPQRSARRRRRAAQPLPAPALPWPIRYVVDEDGRETGFVAVRGPLTAEQREVLEVVEPGRRLIGWSSYGTFPRVHEVFDGRAAAASGLDGRARPYVERCEAWVHCFRQPERFVPAGIPTLLLSESDFVDPAGTREAAASKAGTDIPAPGRFDLCYVCCPNDFNEATKNWRLARRLLDRLSRELGTTALLIGRLGATDLPDVPGITAVDELPYDVCMAHLARCRVLLVPNVLDASPQLVVEALSLGLPVAVNEQILGGWKYVHPATGRFFTNEDDVVHAVRACLHGATAPRDWLARHGGPKRAERRLARFLGSLPVPGTAPLPPGAFRRARLAGEVS